MELYSICFFKNVFNYIRLYYVSRCSFCLIFTWHDYFEIILLFHVSVVHSCLLLNNFLLYDTFVYPFTSWQISVLFQFWAIYYK